MHTHTHTRYTERGNNLSTEENVKEEKGEEIRGVKTRKDAQNDIHGAAIVAQEWCQQRRRRKKQSEVSQRERERRARTTVRGDTELWNREKARKRRYPFSSEKRLRMC